MWIFVALWTVTLQAPLSTGFSRQEYWSGLPFPPAEDLPDPGMEPVSPALQADSLPSQPLGKPLINSFFKNIYYLFVYLACQVLIAACRIFDLCCSMWHLVPWPGIETRPPALGAQVLATEPPGKSQQFLTKTLSVLVRSKILSFIQSISQVLANCFMRVVFYEM